MRRVFFILLFLPKLFFSQNAECNVIKNSKETGYCLEYYSPSLKNCSKEEAAFKHYAYYYKGKRHLSLALYWSGKNVKISQGERKVQKTDSIETLNGIYKVTDRDGQLRYTYLFEKGYCKKTIYWSKRSKNKEGAPSAGVVCEYDYSSFPFNIHIIEFKNGEIWYNAYHYVKDDSWIEVLTKDIMSENILEFKGVPTKK